MTDPASTAPPGRSLGAVLVVLAAVSVVLLAMHPGGAPSSFADVLKDESDHLLQSAIVHGGSMATLAAELAALAVLATRLGAARAPVIVGLALSAISFLFLALALTLDGLVIPDIARRYLAAPAAAVASGRALFVLVGTLIRFLMPIGLAFQGAAAMSWGVALWRSARRVAGGVAFAFGALLVAALGVTITELNPYVLMGGFLSQALWLIVLGAGLVRTPA
jgi:hypothetical protein